MSADNQQAVRAARGETLSSSKIVVAASPGVSPDSAIVWLREQGTGHAVVEIDGARRVVRVLIETRNPECAQALYEYERDRLRQGRAQRQR